MATIANGVVQTPVGGFQFTVHTLSNGARFDWIPEGEVGFAEVTGLDDVTEAHEYGEGNDLYSRMIPGRSKPFEITLSKGHDRNTRLIKWRNAVKERTALPQESIYAEVVVRMYNRQGAPGAAEVNHELIAEWRFRDAWPSELHMGDLKKLDSEPNVLSVKLVGYGPPEQTFPALA